MIIGDKLLRSFIFFISVVSVFASDDPRVEIEDGVIRGSFWKTRQNRTISAFTGIPYAEPPVGLLRFKAPVPKKPWTSTGILNATNIHVSCPQRDVFARKTEIEGDEDCLFLNVYTPKVASFDRDLLPVMVFIHGGGFFTGTGNSLLYGPDILLDKDVVFVAMNYRLGPLGFLSTGDEVVPGNNGLKDQNLALKWVKKNIKSFGGDARRVTIFGNSAGGASVHYHMLSPQSRGLFQKGITQSGNSLCPWALSLKDETQKNTQKLAESLNCTITSNTEMVDCLRKVDANTIIGQDKIFMKWDYDPMMPFKPVIEPNIEGAFLTEHPANLMKAGKGMDVPVIAGTVTDEGLFKTAGLNKELLNEFGQRFEEIAPYALLLDRFTNDTASLTKAIKEFYFKDKQIEDSLDGVTKIYSDIWLTKCTNEFSTLFKKYYSQPLYRYLFSYRGTVSVTEYLAGGRENLGVCHEDELIYLSPIGYFVRPDWVPNKTDQTMMRILPSLWTNFASAGNPTPVVDDLINTKWKPYTLDKEEYLNIYPGNLKIKNKVFPNRSEFWKNLTQE